MPQMEADGRQRIDQLVNMQQFAEAARETEKMRLQARESGDEQQLTRALIQETQLRTGLHGYETAVRFLRDQSWPEAPRHRLILGLFYGRSLAHYLGAYNWQIQQREKVASDDELDLELWTADQIRAEVHRAYAEVWHHRQSWGGESIGDLSEFIEQNDYPPRIRGTLRDAVTYLWVELLADRLFWGPRDANEIYRLDLEALLSTDGADSAGSIELDDPGHHPLVKVHALLTDLEQWHLSRDEPEAAFEAYLTLVRQLMSSFDHADERLQIRQHLQSRLDALGNRLPWWSMGQSVLAELVRSMDLPTALVEARQLAIAGAEAHPKSSGGQRCRQTIEGIEQKSFQIAAMAVDGADRRSLEITHTNLDRLYFRAYRFSLEGRVEGATDRGLAPNHKQVEALVKGSKPLVEWQVDLPETSDYRSHRTFDVPPMEQLGAYVIVASARSDFKPESNRLLGVFFQISDIVLRTGDATPASKQVVAGRTWWIETRSGSTGKPLADVELELFRVNWRDGHERVGTLTTSDRGFALLEPDSFESLSPNAGKQRGNRYQQLILSARRGEDRVFHPHMLYAYPMEGEPQEQRRALIFTDRSVYRPGQEILWKVVAYEQSADGRQFETLAGTSLSVSLQDANGEQVEIAEVDTGEVGSASGSFTIPAGRLLGDWSLRALGSSAGVKVEEYKRPTFKVELDDPAHPARLNRETLLTGRAAYYFGLPVSEGEVRWRVTREPVYSPYFFYRVAPTVESRVVAAGESRLDSKGRFEVRFTPEADERLSQEQRRAVHYRYRLEAEVTEGGGETRKADKSLKIGFVAVDARIDTEKAFFVHGEPIVLEARRSHLDGTPYPGQGSWSLVRLIQPDEVPMPADLPAEPDPLVANGTQGDSLRPRWQTHYSAEQVLARWPAGNEVASGPLEHGADGMAVISQPVEAGVYRLIYRTLDAFGAEAERTKDLLVLDEGGEQRIALPAILLAQQRSVEVDGVARFLVHSGLKGQHLDLRFYRHGKEVERQSWISEGRPRVVEVPIASEDRGGLSVDLTLVRDHQSIVGSESVDVPWSNRKLLLELETFRNVLRPGDHETWRVKLKSASGHALAEDTAELLAYMYDKSLELFNEHRPPNPQGLLPGLPATVQLNDNLQQAPTVWHHEDNWYQRRAVAGHRGDSLKFYDGYAIGGPGGRGHMRFRPEVAMMAMDAAPSAPRAMARQSKAAPAPNPAPAMAEQVVSMEGEQSAGSGGADDNGNEGAGLPELRENFSETAFWHPHLLLDDDGGVSFELTAPDSVTEWDLWIHAFSRSLRFASLRETVRTVKDLLVRPYLPRFFREGDRAELRVVVSNSGDEPLAGSLDFEIVDPETQEDLSARFGLKQDQARDVQFSVEPGASTTLSFPGVAPQDPGLVAIRARGKAADHTDGELRPLPVLPSRLYLAQSRFAALDGPGERVLTFEDLAADDDPSLDHESMVVTLDAQLFYAALSSLPYLIDYPYECTEQTLNRFVSTGILTSLFESYPAVGKMAAQLAEDRDTQLEPWRNDDANRKMLLEESPWLAVSRGGQSDSDHELLKVLDPKIAEEHRRLSLAKLEQFQLPSGAFPWWSGGPPSAFTTLYVLEGLSRAIEYRVEVPQALVTQAWSWLADWWQRTQKSKLTEDVFCCPESATYLAWVLTRYPDASWTGNVFSEDDIDLMIRHAWKHWKQQSPRLKGYLALVLLSRDRADDARLVWDSVMDSARTDERLGTYWAPEDRAWIWYNDTVESHAFALRVLTELSPDDPRRAGLVQWLMLDKKLGHWKSTRATAEAVYALVKYLEAEGALGVEEDATVRLGRIERHFEFKPDSYTGAGNQVVVPGPEVKKEMSKIVVEKTTPGTLFASATWHFATDRLPEQGDGDLLRVERRFFRRSLVGEQWTLEPLEEGAPLVVGDQVEVKLAVKALHAAEFVHLRDPRGAGFEPEDVTSDYRWEFGIGHYREIRDSGTNFFFEALPAGEFSLSYRLRAATAGTFRVGPSTLQSMYAPEFVAYSAGHRLEIGGDAQILE